MRDDFLWTEKYRPKRIDDAILPAIVKAQFKSYVAQNNIPHLLVSGSPGIGKTSSVKAMLDEMKADYQFFNGSLEGRTIDTLRTDIQNYVSSVSFSGGRKYVLLDEADFLNPNSFQPALRAFMDTYGTNTGFLFTCNFPSKIIPALQSRCTKISFKVDLKKDFMDLAVKFMTCCEVMLTKENITFDQSVLAQVIKKHFPDCRQIINELQGYAVSGTIDSGILHSYQDVSIKQLIVLLKQKNFTEMRKWASEHGAVDSGSFYTSLYHNLLPALSPVGQGLAVEQIGKFHYESAFCTNQEINFVACLNALMARLHGEWT